MNIASVLSKKAIESRSLSVMAADTIRPSIINGEIPMGAQLKEPEFSEALQVSRSCIREAFMILEREGLLVRNSNKPARVVSFTEKDILNLYQLRSAIEISCLERCLQENLIDIEVLENLCEQIRSSYSEAPEDTFTWIINDHNFHSVFVESCENGMISSIYQSVKYQVEMLICYFAKIAPDRFIPLYAGASHDTLVQYIKAGEHAEAIAFLKKHLYGTPRRMISIMRGET